MSTLGLQVLVFIMNSCGQENMYWRIISSSTLLKGTAVPLLSFREEVKKQKVGKNRENVLLKG